MSIEHDVIPEGERHGIANWEVASISARNALSVSAADVGKVCHVLGDQCYFLADHSPATWETLTVVPAATPTIAYTVANNAALVALSATLTVDDIGKGIWQTDIQVLWLVLDNSPLDLKPATFLIDSASSGVDGGGPYLEFTYTSGATYKAYLADAINPVIADHAALPLAHDPLAGLVKQPAVIEDFAGNSAKFLWTYINGGDTTCVYTEDAPSGMSDAFGVATLRSAGGIGLAPCAYLYAGYEAGTIYKHRLSSQPLTVAASFSVTELGGVGTELYFFVRISQLNGLSGAGVGYDAEGCSLWLDHANVNWRCQTGGSTTSGSQAHGLAVNTRVTLAVKATATSCEFYLNDTLLATVTTNIPATELCGVVGWRSAGVFDAPVDMHIDLCALYRTYADSAERNIPLP